MRSQHFDVNLSSRRFNSGPRLSSHSERRHQDGTKEAVFWVKLALIGSVGGFGLGSMLFLAGVRLS